MARHYVTFGQQHVHRVNGHTLDTDSIACYNAADYSQGRDKAFELFGRSFFTDYHENEIGTVEMEYFPRGIIEIEEIKE